MNISVLYKDKDVLVINKPAGLLVHGIFNKSGPKHSEETLVDWLAKNYPETKEVGDTSEDGLIKQQRGGIVHRLDRGTSGVMVIARNQRTFEYLKKMFQGRLVKKEYLALVWGRIHERSGVIDRPISIKDGTVKRTVFKGKMPRPALTEYQVLTHYAYRHGKHADELTLLKIMPKTGRTHQIRVHLSSIGHAVAGDKLYGKKGELVFDQEAEEGEQVKPFLLDRQFLHAARLEFTTGAGRSKIVVDAPLPSELEEVLARLKKDE